MALLTATGIVSVGENVRVTGSYNCAVAEPPPATSTLPSGSRVAVPPDRAAFIWPAGIQVFGGPDNCAVRCAATAEDGAIKPAPIAAAAARTPSDPVLSCSVTT